MIITFNYYQLPFYLSSRVSLHRHPQSIQPYASAQMALESLAAVRNILLSQHPVEIKPLLLFYTVFKHTLRGVQSSSVRARITIISLNFFSLRGTATKDT